MTREFETNVPAARYGSQILRWMETPMFVTIVGALVVLAVVGTIVSADNAG
jgi:hypothetical protein